MSKFTDLFIERPVLATVISLLILIIGFRSLLTLQVSQYPKLENTVITVQTAYPGADSSLVQGFITTPLETKIASAEGINYLTSESRDGVSTISAYLELNFNPEAGFTNVLSKVQEALGDLPREAEPPVLTKVQGSGFALMYVAFSSDTLSLEQISDYVLRVVQPRLATVDGIAEAQLLTNKRFAMRIWLQPDSMAGLGVSAKDIFTVINEQNVQAAAGNTRSEYIQVAITPDTDLKTPEQFGNIVIKKNDNGSIVRLKDVAKVELGSESYNADVRFNGIAATFIGVTVTPSANPLQVIKATRVELEKIKTTLPEQIKLNVVFDATEFIQASINEVVKTIFEATAIVVFIIFLFLGTIRSVIVPVIAIPLSLIGVMTVLFFMGYSLNLLTLLALILAIGMVVDDAIVVVENIYRHIEKGLSPYDAAIKGSREIAMPIVAMTLTLAAVYSPIVFMSGVTGALFKEFAFTLAAAVVISGIIALTLSPMMCSKFLSKDISRHKFVSFLEHQFKKLDRLYHKILSVVFHHKPAVLLFALFVLLSCFFLYMNSKKELAPQEDRGVVFALAYGPQTSTIEYMTHYANEIPDIYDKIESKQHHFMFSGTQLSNRGLYGVRLKPWSERTQSQKEVQQFLQGEFQKIPGLQFQVFGLPSVPTGGFGLPIQIELISTLPIEKIYPFAQDIIGQAMQTGKFNFILTTLRFNKPEFNINIDRSKAALAGVDVADIATTLSTAFGENYVNWFDMENRNYRVIPQLSREFRQDTNSINDLFVQTDNGAYVPLSTFVTINQSVLPNSFTRFQQLNSIELVGSVSANYSLGQGLDELHNIANRTLPKDISVDYAGQSRQYVEEGSGLIVTFFFALVIIYLVLAAQFENFRDPLVILIAVPMAISGALITTNLGLAGATINIYTQVGLITLIGLIAKHGILIVEFANQLQRKDNLSAHDAVIEAATIRLRPILMTSFAMIFSVLPLLLADGPGAVSRFNIGIVIATGMSIGTLFTLIILPTIYTLKTHTILLFIATSGVLGILIYWLFY